MSSSKKSGEGFSLSLKKKMIRFQELVSATIKSLIRRNISPSTLVAHVMTLGAFKSHKLKRDKCQFQYFVKKLQAADSIENIFLTLNDYFSSTIMSLNTSSKSLAQQKTKQNYRGTRKISINMQIFECQPEFGPESDADHTDIFVKVDSQYENFTVAEIEVFCHKLSEILCVSPQGVLRLCQVEKGCFQLMFQVSSFVQQEIIPLFKQQRKTLAIEHVIKLPSVRCHHTGIG